MEKAWRIKVVKADADREPQEEGAGMTQDEMQKLWEALSLIYGRSLQAATVTVLIEDGDSAVRFVTSTFPQQPKEGKK